MIREIEAQIALDEVESGLHDYGTDAVAVCVATGIINSTEVSMRSIWRAQSILRAIGREVK